jgi:hypothetical protein
LSVVILKALSLFGSHGALAASRTMPAVAGMLLVAIQNGNIQAQIQRQRFVPLQTAVDLVKAIPQLADVHGGVYSSHGIGADHVPSQPPFPESGGRKGIQRIETSQTSPAHRQGGLQNLRGKCSRLLTRVGDFVEHLAGKVKHLLGIANQAVE